MANPLKPIPIETPEGTVATGPIQEFQDEPAQPAAAQVDPQNAAASRLAAIGQRSAQHGGDLSALLRDLETAQAKRDVVRADNSGTLGALGVLGGRGSSNLAPMFAERFAKEENAPVGDVIAREDLRRQTNDQDMQQRQADITAQSQSEIAGQNSPAANAVVDVLNDRLKAAGINANVPYGVSLGAIEKIRNSVGLGISNDTTRDAQAVTKLIAGNKIQSAEEIAKAKAEAAASRAVAGRAVAQSKADAKSREKSALTAIPGFRSDPEIAVKPEVAQKLRDAAAENGSLVSTIDKIEGLYKKYGNAVLPGPQRAEMNGLIRDLQLQLKGPNQFQLGVLTGPDLALLEEVTGNPTKAQAGVVDFFTDGQTSLAKLNNTRSQSRARFINRMQASGYTPESRATAQTPSGKPFAKKQYSPSANKTRYLDANGAELEVVDGRR